jgi:hypothetical protein
MSRVADQGNDPFADGHSAAGVLAAAFFCAGEDVDDGTRDAIRAWAQARLVGQAIYAPRPEEDADPALVAGLVEDLDAGIDSLRRAGHNVIFAAAALKALRQVPEAATPARMKGLRAMVRSFGSERDGAAPDGAQVPGLDDGRKFVEFVFTEYVAALDLYLGGRGHHGFAGHILTIGHALLDLHRMGHAATASKGRAAYGQFVARARRGADLGGRKVAAAPPQFPSPREREYWVEQLGRPVGRIIGGHRVKYPYSFYALLQDLPDGELKESVLQRLYHLTAVS